MSVTLSLFAGAGAQFLDNSGNVLTGGLVYSYAAGTTTPLATYTSNTGVTPHSNPIILDAAGRVPGGEIWMTAESSYKFVLKDANSVLIGTYDNISINQNFTNITYTGTLTGGSASFTNVTYSGALTGGSASITNSAYSGTLTGGTGIVNIGSGQFYKAVDGKIGVNTISPVTNFHINGGSNQIPLLVSSTGAASLIYFRDSNTTGTYGPAIGSTGDNLVFSSKYGVNEAMRIVASGQLCVGTTSVITNAKINTVFDGSFASGIGIQNSNGADNGYYLAFYNSGASLQGSIIQTNSTTTAYNTSSDYRLKENIAPMTGALDKIVQLKPVTYTWKENGQDGQGFIAHELQEIMPDCVTGKKDAVDENGKPFYQGVDVSFLVATLTAAIQELNAKIVKLETK